MATKRTPNLQVTTILTLLLLFFSTCSPAFSSSDQIFSSEKYSIKAHTLLDNLKHPWSITALDKNEILITERNGDLLRYNLQTNKLIKISGLPDFHKQGQGGLLGITKDVNFESNQFLYIAYVGKDKNGLGTEVLRAKLDHNQLLNQSVIFKALPKSRGGRHFGGRILQDAQRNLYITLGDRGDRERAQKLDDHAGSLIRIRPDGTIPKDNPWSSDETVRPHIYTYGNRNIQGIVIDPNRHQIWMHEHGPQGGDELNLVVKGSNYGWPVITFGKEYVIGTSIGEGSEKPGMEQPVYYWTPSIAPSGMTLYTGNLFTRWQNNLLLGSLKFGLLVRLTLKDNKVVHEERIFDGKLGRIRDVYTHKDGSILLLTDANNGRLIRLTPANDE